MKLFTQYNRITLWVLVTFFLISCLVYYFLMRSLLFRELDLSLTKIEKRLEDYVHQHNAFPIVQSLDDLHISYAKTDQAGGSQSFRLIPPVEGKNSDNIRELTFFLELDHQWYKITVSRNLEGINGTARMVMKFAIITLFIVIIASLMVNRFVFRKLWQPFYTSITTVSKFQLGKNNLMQFPKTRIEEFDFMNSHLKKMAERVDKEYLILKEFTENASHEMQTPLAIIRSKLDLAIQDQQLSATQSATLKSAYVGVKRLTGLNRSLLLLAKIGNNQFDEIVIVDMKDRLYEKIVQFEELWKDRLEITYQLSDASIYANSNLIDILLNNLFSNASKHNIQDGKVVVFLDNTTLEIKNTGRPVALDETRLFKRFYKEAVDDNNNGLGLSIAKQICDLSGVVPSYSFSGNIHTFTLKWG